VPLRRPFVSQEALGIPQEKFRRRPPGHPKPSLSVICSAVRGGSSSIAAFRISPFRFMSALFSCGIFWPLARQRSRNSSLMQPVFAYPLCAEFSGIDTGHLRARRQFGRGPHFARLREALLQLGSAAAEREFKRAVDFNPGYATARHWYAHYFLVPAQPEQAGRNQASSGFGPTVVQHRRWIGLVPLPRAA
jgi:hypothetical protein